MPKVLANHEISRRQPNVDTTIEDDFFHFEQLERSLQMALWELSQRMSAEAVFIMTKQRPAHQTLLTLREQETREIQRYAYDYRSKNGNLYPHLAAHASIQRYYSDGLQNIRRRRFSSLLAIGGDNDMKVPKSPRRRRRRRV